MLHLRWDNMHHVSTGGRAKYAGANCAVLRCAALCCAVLCCAVVRCAMLCRSSGPDAQGWCHRWLSEVHTVHTRTELFAVPSFVDMLAYLSDERPGTASRVQSK
jgi:hypothetical protein